MTGQDSRLSVITRWECPTCGEPYFAGSGHECNGSRTDPHPVVDLVQVEYVPASQLAGAVERAEKAERERDEAIRTLGCLADEFAGMPIATDLSILGGQ